MLLVITAVCVCGCVGCDLLCDKTARPSGGHMDVRVCVFMCANLYHKLSNQDIRILLILCLDGSFFLHPDNFR